MKNTAQVRKDAATKAASVQTKTSRRATAAKNPTASAPADFLILEQVSKDAEAAIANLERVGNAAVALVMMNAFEIEKSINLNRGWETLEVHGFGKGSLALARTVSTKFAGVFENLKASAAKNIEHLKAGCLPPKSNAEERQDLSPWCEIENCLKAFRHCLDLQNWVLSYCNDSECGGLTVLMDAELNEADHAIELLYSKLADAKRRALAHMEVAS